MFKFKYIPRKYNPNWPEIPDHWCRMLITNWQDEYLTSQEILPPN